MIKLSLPTRNEYFYQQTITTRWMDNDIFGHVNNVTYYSYFDTIVNSYLIEAGGFDIVNSPLVGYIVQSNCFYHQSIAYPEIISGAFRVNRIGNSSVEYGVAIFKKGVETACAHGTMTHVFVNRSTEKSTPINGQLKEALSKAMIS
jgi:acyl-CoA thioester hydrolase